MLYVITEDTNSGRDFWSVVFETLLNPTEYELVDFNTALSSTGKIVPVCGNCALDGLVDKALQKAKQGDALFVAFDSIGTSIRINTKTGKKEKFDSGDFINNTSQKCKMMGVDFYVTSYYCFEEIYLSYIEVENIVATDSNKPQLAGVLKYVRECINNHSEYYDRNRPEVQSVIQLRRDAQKNKEHFADALLYQATYAIKTGRFTISKEASKPLMCWIRDCQELSKVGKQNRKYPTQYDCDNCVFKMKGCNTIDKLIDLNNNSLIGKTSITFSDIKRKFAVQI